MMNFNDECKQLGYFSEEVAADTCRKEFDIKNHSLIHAKKNPDFLFIGDSITQFWELNAYFNKPGQLIINRGIAGDNTTYLNKRFLVDALQLKPNYCIMGIGINDTMDLEGDYWKLIPPLAYDTVLSNAQKNITDIIEKASASSTTLILASLLPISMEISLHEAERKRFVCDLNAWLALTAKQNNLIFINYYAATSYPDTNQLLDDITYDGLHPNAHGYERMAAVLKNTLYENNIDI
ncbi:MAG: GDSL-type esterase/lipase family protein [Lachnospiraceae bacterium]